MRQRSRSQGVRKLQAACRVNVCQGFLRRVGCGLSRLIVALMRMGVRTRVVATKGLNKVRKGCGRVRGEDQRWRIADVESEEWVVVDEDALVDGSGKRRDRSEQS